MKNLARTVWVLAAISRGTLLIAAYGGSTCERFRKRGLFTQVVGARIGEALNRGIANVCVDALPTSEPILKKHGFERVTYTQPFCLLK